MSSTNLSLREAAHRLGVSVTTLRRKINKGEIKACLESSPFGDSWMIEPSELDRVVSICGGPPPQMEGVKDGPVSSLEGVGEGGGPPVEGAGDPGRPGGDPEGPPGGGGGDHPIHDSLNLALVDLVSKAMDRSRELETTLNGEREARTRAERRAEMLASELSSYRRALAEQAESLAEERARTLEERSRRLMLEQGLEVGESQQRAFAAQPRFEGESQESQAREDLVQPKMELPFMVETQGSRVTWGSRLKRWIFGRSQTG